MKKLLIIPIAFLIAGCTPYHAPEVKALNKARLQNTPEYIGTLPDGRVIGRYWINNGNDMHTHFVYVISDNSSTSVNYSVSQGKTIRNETIVVINGKEFVEKKP